MTFLYKDLEFMKNRLDEKKEMPQYIEDNLNKKFKLRPYQKESFENFVTYYESNLNARPTQVLFHMATGSGKTLIMAGLMLYLYEKGYCSKDYR